MCQLAKLAKSCWNTGKTLQAAKQAERPDDTKLALWSFALSASQLPRFQSSLRKGFFFFLCHISAADTVCIHKVTSHHQAIKRWRESESTTACRHYEKPAADTWVDCFLVSELDSLRGETNPINLSQRVKTAKRASKKTQTLNERHSSREKVANDIQRNGTEERMRKEANGLVSPALFVQKLVTMTKAQWHDELVT